MTRTYLAGLLVPIVVVASPSAALAGMPSVTLTDVAEMRLQAISFFLAGLLLSAWFIKLIWNYLARDWQFLPRLTFLKSLGVVTLWGLLFILVLTMISGARELLTPGAWKKDGLTYKLNDPNGPAPSSEQSSPYVPGPKPEPLVIGPTEGDRRQKLESLRTALWDYARNHEKQFPADRSAADLPAGAWQLPGPARFDYIFVSGVTPDMGKVPLAYEPELFGPQRLVLLADGDIRLMDVGEIIKAVPEGLRR